MCGLVGWVDFAIHVPDYADVIDRMTTSMSRRGPDSSGTFIAEHVGLGHRRLAVIDPGSGQQPLVATLASGHRVVLIYTGEVYNYRELRAELVNAGHTFTTRTDTEVVLRAHLQWGVDAVERLNGMFAFAVWDESREELVLARDRMGVKPLYYHPYSQGVLFASEPKGIFAHGRYRPQMRLESLSLVLNPRLPLHGETPLKDVFEVKPGHVVTMNRAGIRERAYWQLARREHEHDEATTAHHVRDLLEDIVARQLISDVPLSCMLSGGLDSTLITALAARTRARAGAPPLHTYSIEFDSDVESFRPTALRPEVDAPYARAAAAELGTQHHSVVATTADVLETLPEALAARDLPTMGQFDTSMYLLFRAMRQTSTVALSGEAADEIFGGYPWFHDPALIWRERFPWIGDAPNLADCLNHDVQAQIRPYEAENDRYLTLRAACPRLPGDDPAEARMREALFFNLQGPLAYLLNRADRMSMAVGLEVRVPYTDHRLVEYGWNIPWHMKTSDGNWKTPLRNAARGLVPERTLQRRKSGYPGVHDQKYEEHVLNVVDEMMRRDTPLTSLLDRRKLREILSSRSQSMTWLNAAHFLTPLVETYAWVERYNVELVS